MVGSRPVLGPRQDAPCAYVVWRRWWLWHTAAATTAAGVLFIMPMPPVRQQVDKFPVRRINTCHGLINFITVNAAQRAADRQAGALVVLLARLHNSSTGLRHGGGCSCVGTPWS